jgi:hypothetical protein
MRYPFSGGSRERMAQMAIKLKAGSSKPGAAISERHRNPAEVMAETAAAQPRSNYVAAGVCAILAALIFGVIVAIMYMDWTALGPA